MSQVTFAGCDVTRTLNTKPTVVPGWIGTFTDPERPPCLGNDPQRRKDIPQRYGSKEPVVDREPDEWVRNLTRVHNRPTERITTENGAILLPFGESHHPEYYIPTVNTLNDVPLRGSRMLSLSDRYFDR